MGPLCAKGDHEKAYRQWPIHEDDYNLVETLVWNDKVGPHGGFEVYAHRALPFGVLSSVTIYIYNHIPRCMPHPEKAFLFGTTSICG